MKSLSYFAAVCMLSFVNDTGFAQTSLETYQELNNHKKADTLQWNNQVKEAQFSFASDNIHYAKEEIPNQELSKKWHTFAWKGEKVHTQLVYFSAKDANHLTLDIEAPKNVQGQALPKEAIKAQFVRFVKTDVFANGCGVKKLHK